MSAILAKLKISEKNKKVNAGVAWKGQKTAFGIRALLPTLSIAFCLLAHHAIPMNGNFIVKPMPYLTYVLTACLIISGLFAVLSYLSPQWGKRYTYKAPFLAVLFLLLNLYNLATLKYDLILSLFFPYPDKILAVYWTDGAFLLKCLFHSFRLLITGVFFGAVAGFLTGIAIGWSKRASYWISPLIRGIGPIPSTAWIPLALVVFPTTFVASAFLIALAVWFPMTVLTSSGIQNVEKAYFEVASTLGASKKRQVFKVAIPGAMPSMFIGFFNGTVTSFLTLMSAEMIGVKFGIGWYINWKREVMAYANVYAGLILIAVLCSFLISVLFKVRARVLNWQKGLIRW